MISSDIGSRTFEDFDELRADFLYGFFDLILRDFNDFRCISVEPLPVFPYGGVSVVPDVVYNPSYGCTDVRKLLAPGEYLSVSHLSVSQDPYHALIASSFTTFSRAFMSSVILPYRNL